MFKKRDSVPFRARAYEIFIKGSMPQPNFFYCVKKKKKKKKGSRADWTGSDKKLCSDQIFDKRLSGDWTDLDKNLCSVQIFDKRLGADETYPVFHQREEGKREGGKGRGVARWGGGGGGGSRCAVDRSRHCMGGTSWTFLLLDVDVLPPLSSRLQGLNPGDCGFTCPP